MKGRVAKSALSLVLALVLVCGVVAEGSVVQAQQESTAVATATDKQKAEVAVVGNMVQGAIQQGNWVYYSYAEMGKRRVYLPTM